MEQQFLNGAWNISDRYDYGKETTMCAVCGSSGRGVLITVAMGYWLTEYQGEVSANDCGETVGVCRACITGALWERLRAVGVMDDSLCDATTGQRAYVLDAGYNAPDEQWMTVAPWNAPGAAVFPDLPFVEFVAWRDRF